MNVQDMIKLYSVSYFADATAAGWFEANEHARRIGDREMHIDARAVGGLSVPVLNGRELVAAMIENVEDSRLDVRNTGERLAKAKRDGLLNMREFREQDDETQEAWMAAINIVKGDYQRAVSEMNHWQTYATEASAGKLPVLKDATGSGVALIRALADSKALEPDRRLPPEREEDVA